MAQDILKEATSKVFMESRPLLEKWGKVFEKISTRNTTFGGFEKKNALARVMENTQQYLNHRMTESMAVQSSDIGQFKRFALDVLSVAVPNLIAFDLVSVQPISNRVGMVNYIEYVYNSTKGEITAGEAFTNPWAKGSSDPTYTSKYIPRQPLVDGTAQALSWVPVIPGSVKLPGNVVDDGQGNLGTYAGSTFTPDGGTINYQTGTVTLASAATAGESISYAYMNEVVPAKDVPQIGLRLKSIAVEVKARHLAAIWSFEAGYELTKEYSYDINTELSKMAAGELNHQIDLEVCQDLFAAAGTSVETWSRDTLQAGETVATHYDSFPVVLDRLATRIYENTKRVKANWVLCGTQVAIVLNNCRAFQPANLGTVSGPYFAGTVNGMKVFVSPDVDPMTYVVGYKGSAVFEAGYVLCPYLPIMQSDLVTLMDMSQQKGFISLYATALVNPALYAKGEITL